MNEYTVANARKIYCEIYTRKRLTKLSRKKGIADPIKEDGIMITFRYHDHPYDDQLKLLADYSWYIRIWARLTYRI